MLAPRARHDISSTMIVIRYQIPVLKRKIRHWMLCFCNANYLDILSLDTIQLCDRYITYTNKYKCRQMRSLISWKSLDHWVISDMGLHLYIYNNVNIIYIIRLVNSGICIHCHENELKRNIHIYHKHNLIYGLVIAVIHGLNHCCNGVENVMFVIHLPYIRFESYSTLW